MTSIEEKSKKLQLWFALGALIIYVAYLAVGLFIGTDETPVFSYYWWIRLSNRSIMILPYLLYMCAAIISNRYKEKRIRYIPYLLVGFEFVLTVLNRYEVVGYHPLQVFEGLGWLSYSWSCTIILILAYLCFFVMPFAKRPSLILYSAIVTGLYVIAMVVEISVVGFQVDTFFKFLAGIIHQASLIFFSYEMTTENRIPVYSALFDFFFGLDWLDDGYSEMLDELEQALNEANQKNDAESLEEDVNSVEGEN